MSDLSACTHLPCSAQSPLPLHECIQRQGRGLQFFSLIVSSGDSLAQGMQPFILCSAKGLDRSGFMHVMLQRKVSSQMTATALTCSNVLPLQGVCCPPLNAVCKGPPSQAVCGVRADCRSWQPNRMLRPCRCAWLSYQDVVPILLCCTKGMTAALCLP